MAGSVVPGRGIGQPPPEGGQACERESAVRYSECVASDSRRGQKTIQPVGVTRVQKWGVTAR